MLLLLGQDHFSVEKMHEFDVFNECVTDQPTNRPTNQPTDRAYYRDARTHLKDQKAMRNPTHFRIMPQVGDLETKIERKNDIILIFSSSSSPPRPPLPASFPLSFITLAFLLLP